MQRLRGLDSMFVSIESPSNPFHVGAVTVLDPSTAPPGAPHPFDALRAVIEDRIHLVPMFRRRLVEVPGGLGHPRWIEDPGFDLDAHLHRGALPSPGGPVQLAEYAAEVFSQPLDRSRPLWEIHVVEGVESDLVAGVAKLHHSVVDGVAGAEVTAHLMDLSPEVAPAPAPAEPWHPDEVPSAVSLVGDALWGLRALPPAVLRAATRTCQAGWRIRSRNRQPDTVAPPSPFRAPRTALATRLGRRRAVGLAQVERDEVDHVRRATGATVNDVILAITGGALRAHLEDRGGLPERSLVGFVPVSVREDADTLETGVNRLSGMFVSLATAIEDPVARLEAVSACTRQAKAQDRALGPDLFGAIADLALPAALRPITRFMTRSGATSALPPFNVTVSSFPGSPLPLYCAGGKMVSYHPFGPVFDGVALNITASSYLDQIGFGLIACRNALPDVEMLARRIPDAMTQLSKAAAI
ncbi:MAG TPA: wax ester/triacylglycerol synthase family O-acyltransferase [Acidimicrobiales bacterium]|nr:wax ester/triacylglycerol synthase family O-acyltransferase [Acidimicrobiales bacterium]